MYRFHKVQCLLIIMVALVTNNLFSKLSVSLGTDGVAL